MSRRQSNDSQKPGSSEVVDQAKAVLAGKSGTSGLKKIAPFLGPAFIASVAYVDPGNFATNIQGGAQFGYMLLWVIIASNIMAMLIQSLSAKLGIATGKNLAELCREQFPMPVVWIMWVLMELVAMATDLAEFLGAALGFNLLLGIPLWLAGILTAIATFLILGFERSGFRSLEAVITSFVGVIAISYIVETFLDKPDWAQVFHAVVVPQFSGTESILLATGILGATVMPHAIFLHSALTQNRIVVRKPKTMQKLFRYELIDVLIAMGAASLINAAMLIMAASTFHRSGLTSIGTIEQAYVTLEPLLGKAASWVFGLSLLASGLSSASVGTMAGQVIMQGFLHFEIPVWIRRLVTMIPSLIVIFLGLDPTRTLVISQVALSFGLPFAIIPLVRFTSQKKIMGVLVNRKFTTLAASLVAILILGLNFLLIFFALRGGA
ncbi:MAG: Nramp family divalent metal transporter [Leptolinea sp.]|jgi:manganese transport protein|nr:Nramp family divalent metal transporter [Leptolinea sp.]